MIGALRRAAAAPVRTAAALLAGDRSPDPWGLDPALLEAAAPALDLLYNAYWRVTATGTQHIPAQGAALVAANHAGVLPWDAAMVATALRRAGRREPRVLLGPGYFDLPFLAPALRRAGAVPDDPANAVRLLDEGHVVVCFPESGPPEGPYDVRRIDPRVVEIASRAGAPVVPCGIVGSQEIYPLGPLGLLPLPSRWRIGFGEPLVLSARGPAAAADPALVLELSETVRDRLRNVVCENLIARKGAYR